MKLHRMNRIVASGLVFVSVFFVGVVVPPVLADIAPPSAPVDPLFACPPGILDGESRPMSYVDEGPGALPGGNPYCRYMGDYGGDAEFASYDRVLGRPVMYGTVVHGAPGGSWIAHNANTIYEFSLLTWTAHSQCNEAARDWYVNRSICSDRNFVGTFPKAELDVIGYTPYTLFPGDIGVATYCHYGADWMSVQCGNLVGWVDQSPPPDPCQNGC